MGARPSMKYVQKAPVRVASRNTYCMRMAVEMLAMHCSRMFSPVYTQGALY
jgi:hypothetical protein